ncbi:hypothetical protein [Scytonema sp. NUACC26]|uniref:hypothetical protein n=1 Tax=Scytonema sp. NUACC26 TaxID=3140176 RepID=UPI0034DC014E
MTNSYFTFPTSEASSNARKNAARINQQIALIDRVIEGKTADKNKTDTYFFLSSKRGDAIVFRNGSRKLLDMHLDLHLGFEYSIPTGKGGVVNIELINLLSELSNNTKYLDTSLGLDWLVVAFEVYQCVELRRVNAVSTEMIKATIDDWVRAIQKVDNVNNAIDITEWLMTSAIKDQLTLDHKTTLNKLIEKLRNQISSTTQVTQLDTQPQTVSVKTKA